MISNTAACIYTHPFWKIIFLEQFKLLCALSTYCDPNNCKGSLALSPFFIWGLNFVHFRDLNRGVPCIQHYREALRLLYALSPWLLVSLRKMLSLFVVFITTIFLTREFQLLIYKYSNLLISKLTMMTSFYLMYTVPSNNLREFMIWSNWFQHLA